MNSLRHDKNDSLPNNEPGIYDANLPCDTYISEFSQETSGKNTDSSIAETRSIRLV